MSSGWGPRVNPVDTAIDEKDNRLDERDDRGLSAFRAITLPKAADAVIAVLADAIRGGLYRPGDVLPRERDLADRLEVSRNVVREAIEVLRRAGVLAVKRGPTGGATVVSIDPLRQIVAGLKGPSHEMMLQIAELRRILEKPAFLLAAQRATDDEIDALGDPVERLGGLIDKPEEFFVTDQEFHIGVVRLSKNVLLSEHYEAMMKQLDTARTQFPVAHVALPRAYDNQRDLYGALRTRDPDVITETLDAHLADFEDVILGETLEWQY